jgi:hypothetical protein
MKSCTHTLDNKVISVPFNIDSLHFVEKQSLKYDSSIKHTPTWKQRRCVRFLGLDDIKETISIDYMTQKEIDASWWTSREQKQRSKRVAHIFAFTREQGRSFVTKTIGKSYKL